MKFEHTRTMNWEGAFRGMRNPKNSWHKSDSIFGICNITDRKQFKPLFRKEDLFPGQVDNKGYLLDKEGNPQRVAYKVYESWPYAEVISLGDEDLRLAKQLIRGGSEHRKFMRQIFVCVDISAPMYWWKEFDTYKVATVRNSCSTMHKIHSKPITVHDFETDAIDDVQVEVLDIFKRNGFCDSENGNSQYFEQHVEFCEALREKFNETGDKKYWRALIQALPDSYIMKATLTMNYENLFGMCSKGQRRFHKQNEWSGIDMPYLPNFIGWARTLPYAQDLIFLDELDGTATNQTNN